MKNRYLPLILILIGLGLGLVIHHNFKNLKSPEAVSGADSLAILSEVDGGVSVLPYASMEARKLNENSKDSELELRHLDLVETGADSKVLMKFPSGYELELEPNSKILVEAWGTGPSAPTYLHVIAGNYKMLRAGQRGQIFVQKNRKLIYPEGNVYNESYQLTIKAPEFLDSQTSEVEGNEDDEPVNVNKPRNLPKTADAATELPVTLSNEEIDEVLANQRLAFERCQTNALRENLPAHGKLLVGITIAPTGKVQEVKAISSELNNPSFQNCILSVFQRAQFRAFKGTKIERAYPLEYD